MSRKGFVVFTFDAVPVKFIGLFILFAFSTAWGLWELTRPADRRARTSGVLHLWMSVVMLLMVSRVLWQPFTTVVPLPVITLTQALPMGWFAWLAWCARADRALARHHAGHAVVFGAMTWHLAAMAVKMPHMGPDMAAWVDQESRVGGVLGVTALLGVPFMLWLLWAGVVALRDAIAPRAAHAHGGGDRHARAAAPALALAVAAHGGRALEDAQVLEVTGCHAPRAIGTPAHRLGRLHDAAMTLGMFWMSTGLLAPLLPFMRVL